MRHIYGKRISNDRRKSAGPAAEDELRQAQPLPNSTVMRITEEPAAEDEADSLSEGILSRTPSALRSEMGARLGADFSGVRFHSDTASAQRSRSMGARAWAQGRDVYFGRGGFDPAVAAHELVHTVQQGAVDGNVSQSMPPGTVQLLPDDDDKNIIRTDANQQEQELEEEDDPGKKDAKAIDAIENSLIDLFATDLGVKVYGGFESKLEAMVSKGTGGKTRGYTPPRGVRYLVRAAYRDYAYRDILNEIVAKPVKTSDDVKERVREYKALIQGLSTRIDGRQAEDLAIKTGIFKGKPKYTHKQKQQSSRRAYEVNAGKNGLVGFNPNHVPQLEKIQSAIDNAATPEQAYEIFAGYTGNPQGRFRDKFKSVKVDMNIFRSKLKHMARVVTDYPELKGQIGNMTTIDPTSKTLMSTDSTKGGEKKADFEYNLRPDREGPEADAERAASDLENEKDHYHISPREYHGTHEMGHVLASMLVEGEGKLEFEMNNNSFPDQLNHGLKGTPIEQLNGGRGSDNTNRRVEAEYGLPETDMLMSVLTRDHGKMLRDYNIRKLKNYRKTRKDPRTGLSAMQNQLTTYDSDFYEKGATSKYGSYHPAEFFAEAVADVYSHGKDAKKMSVALVKEYEDRQKAKERKKFNYNKKSWWGKLMSFFMDF